MTDQELKDKVQQDLLDEARQEVEYERYMREDYDYAIEQMDNQYNLYEAVETIRTVVHELNNYGHCITAEDLLNL